MALTNSQYNTIMREYGEQQLKNRREREMRAAKVYECVPGIRALEAEISTQAASCGRQVLKGDAGARLRLREQLAALRREKETLLMEAGFPKDYMEMHYRCPDCQDTGYVKGRRCHCFEQARIRILYEQSNIRQMLDMENFSTLSWQYYDNQKKISSLGMTQLEYMKLVVRQCREFVKGFPDKGRNLLFTGSTGVGKTFLTNCIAHALLDKYFSVIYLSSQDFFELLSRYHFGREAGEEFGETCRHILECDMLIIDDLGTEVNNTFISSQLFYCVNERINRNKGTIISTNLSLGMLRDTYSDRVTSRLMSSYTTIPLYGEDIRLKKR